MFCQLPSRSLSSFMTILFCLVGLSCVQGVGVGVCADRLVSTSGPSALGTGVLLVDLGVGDGFVFAPCVVRRGRESGNCEAKVAKQAKTKKKIPSVTARTVNVFDSVE